MRDIKILSRKEIKVISKMLTSQYGIRCKLDYVFLKNHKNKIYIVNKEAFELPEDKMRIDSLGIYFGTVERTELRLSIEGSQLVGRHAKRGVIDLSEGDMKTWLKGQDVKTSSDEKGFLLVKHKSDLMGCGRIKDGMLLNYYPKARRVNA